MRFDPFGDPFRSLDRLTSQLVSGARTPMGMPMDVWEGDDGYHVALDLPGVDPGDVEISSERNMITIRAERRAEYEGAGNVLLAERPMGRFTRQLQVGEGLDTGRVNATYDNGVLRMTIPVSEAAKPRRIEVQPTSGQQPVSVGASAEQQSQGEQARGEQARGEQARGEQARGEQAQTSGAGASTRRSS
jgi:HSP20 family protein